MANAKIIQTYSRNDDGSWTAGNDVLFQKSSISDCKEIGTKCMVVCNSGRVYFVEQTLIQIEAFLNS